MYKAGETPRDHSHEGSDNPADEAAPAAADSEIG
jgi:hypothetical protein